MNFFESQDRAEKNTGILVFFFVLAVFSLIVLTEILVIVAFGLFESQAGAGYLTVDDFTDAANFDVMIAVAAAIVVLVGLACLYKMSQLRSGGVAVAEALNGRLLNINTRDADEKKLLNVVEEMAIAAGVPVPPVYLLEEPAINAFAAGHHINDAVIGITRGAIQNLSREELQGVIAHEFSHILHGDMRLNIKLMSVLYGIMFLGMLGYFLLRTTGYSRRSSKDSAAPFLMLAIGLMVIGYAGTFFGNIIKAAVSRQREFLADASAVQYTRNPFGISKALKKIGGYGRGAILEHPDASEVSHMLFGQGVKQLFGGIFATHPPIAERIKRVEPSWDGEFITNEIRKYSNPEKVDSSRQGNTMVAGFAAQGTGNIENSMVDSIGQPREEHLIGARNIIQAVPSLLLEMAHEPYGARAVVYLILLDASEEVKHKQLVCLKSTADPQVMNLLMKLDQQEGVDIAYRLPLLDICIPSLKCLTQSQYVQFKNNLLAIMAADNKVDLFEWSLLKILEHSLESGFGKRPYAKSRYKSFKPIAGSCHQILSALSLLDSDNIEQARKAYYAGWQELALNKFVELDQDVMENMKNLDQAIREIAQLYVLQKPLFIKACCRCAETCNDFGSREIEMIRAIAACLDVPVPLHLNNQKLI